MNTIVPSWVEPDPARELAVDALGLSRQADQLADELLPDLSVLTRRARYLSFITWAVLKTSANANPESAIHRLEAELALYEAKYHRRNPKPCLGVVGRGAAEAYLRNSGDVPPARPEALYKSTAFRAYRPLLRALHLLGRSAHPQLTSEGVGIAKAFGRAGRGSRVCLNEASDEEKRLLRKALGFDLRSKTNLRGERRRATLIELREQFGGKALRPALVLPFYARKSPQSKNPVRSTLYRAYVWELLALGLNLAFVRILNDMDLKRFCDLLQKARRCHTLPVSLTEDFDAANADTPRHVVALLRHACSLRPSTLGLQGDAEDLAKCLFNDSPRAFLEALLTRHEDVKGGEAWVRRLGKGSRLQRLAPPRKGFPDRASLHPYRLSAFYELAEDLDLWR
jgi:hypothetical protein